MDNDDIRDTQKALKAANKGLRASRIRLGVLGVAYMAVAVFGSAALCGGLEFPGPVFEWIYRVTGSLTAVTGAGLVTLALALDPTIKLRRPYERRPWPARPEKRD